MSDQEPDCDQPQGPGSDDDALDDERKEEIDGEEEEVMLDKDIFTGFAEKFTNQCRRQKEEEEELAQNSAQMEREFQLLIWGPREGLRALPLPELEGSVLEEYNAYIDRMERNEGSE